MQPMDLEIKSTRITYFFKLVTSYPLLSFFIPFLIVLIGRFIIFKSIEPPLPLIQDEFSYLLAGDTFASFRMTNPMHPFWEHFETIHVLVKPTYMSKYPPMQGIVLAMGQLFFGQPWIAVVLSMAIFCGLLPWTFKAWVSDEWAMIGTLIATYKIGIISYWTDSYWGGSVAAIGGALVLGSVKRLADKPTSANLVIFSIGSCILVNSRPFEGLIFLVGCSCYLLYQWYGKYKNILPILVKNAVIPTIIITPIILFMGLYNYRVTNHVTELPYTEFNKQYAIWSPFIWQQTPGKEPTYRLDFIKRTWVDWDTHTKLFSRQHPITTFVNNFKRIVQFYIGNVFYAFLFFLILVLIFGGRNIILSIFLDKENRPIMGFLLFYIITTNIILEILPHYTAPAAALIYLALIMAIRTFSLFSYKDIPLGVLGCLTLSVFFLMVTTPAMKSEHNRFLYPKTHFLEKRKQVLSILNQQPGLQLVFVTQGKNNDPNEIWVFNQANIDASKIVWANDISPEKNQRLINYYHHTRTIWKLNDDAELTLASYNNSKKQSILIIKNPTPPI